MFITLKSRITEININPLAIAEYRVQDGGEVVKIMYNSGARLPLKGDTAREFIEKIKKFSMIGEPQEIITEKRIEIKVPPKTEKLPVIETEEKKNEEETGSKTKEDTGDKKGPGDKKGEAVKKDNEDKADKGKKTPVKKKAAPKKKGGKK
jgi:hypothetical protein